MSIYQFSKVELYVEKIFFVGKVSGLLVDNKRHE